MKKLLLSISWGCVVVVVDWVLGGGRGERHTSCAVVALMISVASSGPKNVCSHVV